MPSATIELSPQTREFYRGAMDILNHAGIPFLVGGAYALERYTGIVRHTKDFDVFLRPADCRRALEKCSHRGFRAELTFPHWLGKVYSGDEFVDLIFGSGNGLLIVDDEWFAHAVEAEVLGKAVRLCPVEETICSKAFVMERERYDGADIVHLLRARAGQMDWARLCRRFGPDWRLLLMNLVLFGYVYPEEKAQVPRSVLQELTERLSSDAAEEADTDRLCRGPLLSRAQYLVDLHEWGYRDARLGPHGHMTPRQVAIWTAAIGNDTPAAPEGMAR